MFSVLFYLIHSGIIKEIHNQYQKNIQNNYESRCSFKKTSAEYCGI